MSKHALDFVAVGPQRTGTTWLDRMLRAHPALCLPKDVKETMFFDRRFEKGVDWYTWHFRHCEGGQQRGEVAPTYFDDERALRRIQVHRPDCKVIITLRDPAARAFSLYLHHRRRGTVSGSFTDTIQEKSRIVEAGRYAQHVPRWREAFGSEQVLCVLLDDVKEHPADVLKQVCSFLNVQVIKPPASDEKINAASLPRFPRLARGADTLMNILRSYRLHKVVEFGKALGLKSVYHGRSQLPEMSTEMRLRMNKEYEADIRYVERLMGRNLQTWQEAKKD